MRGLGRSIDYLLIFVSQWTAKIGVCMSLCVCACVCVCVCVTWLLFDRQ